MRILVTNDDGIDSVGLHVLARAMRPYGEVVVAAPDQANSGAGAALAALAAGSSSKDPVTAQRAAHAAARSLRSCTRICDPAICVQPRAAARREAVRLHMVNSLIEPP
jgi:5'-nucleotidase